MQAMSHKQATESNEAVASSTSVGSSPSVLALPLHNLPRTTGEPSGEKGTKVQPPDGHAAEKSDEAAPMQAMSRPHDQDPVPSVDPNEVGFTPPAPAEEDAPPILSAGPAKEEHEAVCEVEADLAKLAKDCERMATANIPNGISCGLWTERQKQKAMSHDLVQEQIAEMVHQFALELALRNAACDCTLKLLEDSGIAKEAKDHEWNHRRSKRIYDENLRITGDYYEIHRQKKLELSYTPEQLGEAATDTSSIALADEARKIRKNRNKVLAAVHILFRMLIGF